MGGIKNPEIIHFVESDGKYACIKGVIPTPSKSTRDEKKVRCQNCLRILVMPTVKGVPKKLEDFPEGRLLIERLGEKKSDWKTLAVKYFFIAWIAIIIVIIMKIFLKVLL